MYLVTKGDYFTVLVCVSSGMPADNTTSVTVFEPSLLVSDLLAGKTYVFRVEAETKPGRGQFVQVTTTLPTKPGSVLYLKKILSSAIPLLLILSLAKKITQNC